ncbi:hypothetical protein HNR42_003137 [Deinobacterium chartae]|uniref:ATP-binding protein n=1 Tax=Deinobacterium chartae TaxID=521158 RepID=A0A841I5Y7_9DEIO|nr:BREX system ATP-binding domain-containing protein [Deinobacterium chartae]MBB6099679.1 hypothetical protein [Deinobacterium chartae]
MSMPAPDHARRILNALSSGTVPEDAYDLLAIGNDHAYRQLLEDLAAVEQGQARLRGVRAAYGAGKSFLLGRIAHAALRRGLLVSRVSLNRSGPTLARFETVYHRALHQLQVRGVRGGALTWLLDRWLDEAETRAIELDETDENDPAALQAAVARRTRDLLGELALNHPGFANAVAAYYQAHLENQYDRKLRIAAWLSADPNVSLHGTGGMVGHIGRDAALPFLQAVARMARQVGLGGMLLVLDELDEMRFARRDVRALGWSRLRDLTDLAAGGAEHLLILLAGTPQVYDEGFSELPPLHQRFDDPSLHSPYPNPAGPQLLLLPPTETDAVQLTLRLRGLWERANHENHRLEDAQVHTLVRRWFAAGTPTLRTLVRDAVGVLDRMAAYPDFDPLEQVLSSDGPARSSSALQEHFADSEEERFEDPEIDLTPALETLPARGPARISPAPENSLEDDGDSFDPVGIQLD